MGSGCRRLASGMGRGVRTFWLRHRFNRWCSINKARPLRSRKTTRSTAGDHEPGDHEPGDHQRATTRVAPTMDGPGSRFIRSIVVARLVVARLVVARCELLHALAL